MSNPFLDTPIQADIADQHTSDADRHRARILNEHKRRVGSNENHESTGPLREIINQQDSLYKYINWEDPLRTLGAYFGALGALLATHYYPWTQLALKYGAIGLGVVSATEFANRQFSSDTLLSRLRPRQYRTIPESTLNATLKDVHDFIQYAVVKLQKVALGQDLDRTFAAFLVITAVYFLSGLLSPFGFTVLGLTSLFIAPLVNSSRGREVAQEAKVQAEKLGSAVAEGSVKVQETASNAQQRVGDLAQSGKQAAADLNTKAKTTASQAYDATASTANRAPEIGANAATRAQDTAAQASQAATQNVKKLPELGSNLFSSSSGVDHTASDQHYTHESSQLGGGVPGVARSAVSSLESSDPRQGVSFTSRYPTTATGQDGGDGFGSVPGTVSKSQVFDERV